MAAIALQLRPQHIVLRNRIFVHLFSSSSGNNGGDENESPQPPPPPSQSSSSMSSYFNDVKASLKQSPPSTRRLFESPLRGSPSSPRSSASLEEIQKNLSEFRRRSAPPSPGNAQSNSPSVTRMISFQELYKRNVIDKGEQGSNNQKSGNSFDAIRESLKQLKSNVGAQNQNERFRGGGGGSQRMSNKVIDPYSLKDFKDSLMSKPTPDHIRMRNSNVVRGGSETNLTSIFDEELKNVGGEALASKNELLKMYSYDELGVKLQKLRPVESNKEGQNWFSLKELNERLMKLRVIEEKESEESIVGVSFSELRRNLKKLEENNDGRTQRTSLQRLDILGHLGGTPSFMLQPPKEQLVEKFFHPDNMSSAEKLKLELKKAREEFKMSESDCGSSRVQVAQLTTKIKHLSSVLHKKDKHSRKGLQEMVQRRKKLLRYLRRTDWDSYCLCLSKLGLRDNPNYKI